MKKATFKDAETIRKARAARRASSTTKQTETATEAYTRLGSEIEVKLEVLADALDAHHQRHQAKPADWGYAGDLGHVRELLDEVLAFLGADATRNDDGPTDGR